MKFTLSSTVAKDSLIIRRERDNLEKFELRGKPLDRDNAEISKIDTPHDLEQPQHRSSMLKVSPADFRFRTSLPYSEMSVGCYSLVYNVTVRTSLNHNLAHSSTKTHEFLATHCACR
jgi:hypothetical protein